MPGHGRHPKAAELVAVGVGVDERGSSSSAAEAVVGVPREWPAHVVEGGALDSDVAVEYLHE